MTDNPFRHGETLWHGDSCPDCQKTMTTNGKIQWCPDCEAIKDD